MKGSRFTVFLTFLMMFSLIRISYAQSVTVQVEGHGSSLYAAQLDASRQALMLVLPQLVAVDRRVINDDIQESILSSASGYIEQFEIRRERRRGGQYEIEARVSVSTKAITQFNSLSRDGRTLSVPGSSIVSEFARQKAQAEFFDSFFTRAFTGFPSSAIEVRPVGMLPDEKNVGYVTLKLSLSFDPDFVNALESSLQAVACNQDQPESECDLFVQIFKGAKVKKRTFLGLPRPDEIERQWSVYRLPKNSPTGYELERFIGSEQSRRLFKVQVLFRDSNNRLIGHPKYPEYHLGLQFDVRPPIGRGCRSEKLSTYGVSGRCLFLSVEKEREINIRFKVDQFGDAFNRVESIDASFFLAKEPSFYQTPENNIFCKDLPAYLHMFKKEQPNGRRYLEPYVGDRLPENFLTAGCRFGRFQVRAIKADELVLSDSDSLNE